MRCVENLRLAEAVAHNRLFVDDARIKPRPLQEHNWRRKPSPRAGSTERRRREALQNRDFRLIASKVFECWPERRNKSAQEFLHLHRRLRRSICVARLCPSLENRAPAVEHDALHRFCKHRPNGLLQRIGGNRRERRLGSTLHPLRQRRNRDVRRRQLRPVADELRHDHRQLSGPPRRHRDNLLCRTRHVHRLRLCIHPLANHVNIAARTPLRRASHRWIPETEERTFALNRASIAVTSSQLAVFFRNSTKILRPAVTSTPEPTVIGI